MIDGVPFIISYKREGVLAIDRINDNLQGTTEQSRISWTENQSIVEPFYVHGPGDRVCFITYDYAYPVSTPRPNPIFAGYMQGLGEWSGKWSLRTLGQADWEPYWAIIKPFYLDGDTYLFSYSPALVFGDATVAIDKVNPDGAGTKEVWRSDSAWSSDWKIIEPFYANGKTCLASCGNERIVAFDQVNAGGQGTTEIWRSGFLWNFDLMRMFYCGGKPHVLTYAVEHGTWEIRQVNDDLNGLKFIAEGFWKPASFLGTGAGWVNIEPFYKDKGVYFIGCNADPVLNQSTCQTGIGQFDTSENLIEIVWEGEWSGGWLQIKPFYIPPTPYPPVVPG